MPVFRRDQLRDQQTVQDAFAEAVAHKKVLRLLVVKCALHLEAAFAFAQAENGILAVVLAGDREVRSPVGVAEIRILIAERGALVESSRQSADRDRLRSAAHILQRVLQRSPRSPKRFLAGFKVFRQSNRRYSRHSHRSAWHTAAAIDHFKTKSVGELMP